MMIADNFIWIVYGLAAVLASIAIPLIQEFKKADGYAVAVWVKIATLILMLPFAVMVGLPPDIKFYAVVGLTALLWSISDVIYFRAVSTVGAGVVSRILPSAVVISFPLWFIFAPELLDKYLASPWQSAAVVVIICMSAYLATTMRKCPITWQGMRLIWFVVFAAVVGPIIDKLSLGYAPAKQAPIAYMVIQSSFMLVFWAIFSVVRKPISRQVFLSRSSWQCGLSIGVVATLVLYLKTEALRLCEHPSLLSVILFTDALWIILFYKAIGRKDDSNIWAGLGIVACAAALVLVKSF
ncbi:MAG: hypothetical protein AAB276_09625 [Pseudomonadota bacterium]